MFYIRIHNIAPRLVNILENVNELGITEVSFNPGGWSDTSTHRIIAHLRFEHSEDAVAYALKAGEVVEHEIPQLEVVYPGT